MEDRFDGSDQHINKQHRRRCQVIPRRLIKWPYPVFWGLLSVLGLLVLRHSWKSEYKNSSKISANPAEQPLTSSIPQSSVPPHPHPHTAPATTNITGISRIAWDQVQILFDRQSTTLSQARSRYQLRTGRRPPTHFDTFYNFAKKHECLIDEYPQIYADFAPWYMLAKDDPKIFRRRVEAVSKMAKANSIGIKPWKVANGAAIATDPYDASYWEDWEALFELLPVPDMQFVLNAQDEPRIAFNIKSPTAHQSALNISDTNPFRSILYGTTDFYGLNGTQHCLLPNSDIGFGNLANEKHAFLLSTTTSRFSTDLYPVMSMAKVSPCFSDIVIPHSYNYERSKWSSASKFAYPNNIGWEDKKPVAYWRGAASGGLIINDNYHSFQRFRLIDIGKAHPSLLDVSLSDTSEWTCKKDCDAIAIKLEYDMNGEYQPKEDEYSYKYLIDVDGNAFSGRFLGLLKSGSLVFKSTIFTEYHSKWLIPYEHYIPVLPDLSDLVSKIEWAIAHDYEARLIQERGKAMAERVLTDAQNDCYWMAALIEYKTLWDMGS